MLLLVVGLQALFYLGWLTVYDPLPYVLGAQSRDAYLVTVLDGGTAAGYYSMMQSLNEIVDETDSVGFADPEPRTYYCRADCRRMYFSDRGNPRALEAQVSAASLDYLLVSWGAVTYGQENNAEDAQVLAAWQAYEAALRSLLSTRGVSVAQVGEFELFRMRNGE